MMCADEEHTSYLDCDVSGNSIDYELKSRVVALDAGALTTLLFNVSIQNKFMKLLSYYSSMIYCLAVLDINVVIFFKNLLMSS